MLIGPFRIYFKVHRNYPKRLSESESEKITQHIDAGVDGIGQILGNF